MRQNKSIESELDAWLLFFSSDDVEDIIWLIEHYPVFKPMYETLYEMCLNVEEVMGMFSRELFELDKNTAEFMVDQLGRENTELKEENTELKETCTELKEENTGLKEANAEKDEIIRKLLAENAKLKGDSVREQ